MLLSCLVLLAKRAKQLDKLKNDLNFDARVLMSDLTWRSLICSTRSWERTTLQFSNATAILEVSGDPKSGYLNFFVWTRGMGKWPWPVYRSHIARMHYPHGYTTIWRCSAICLIMLKRTTHQIKSVFRPMSNYPISRTIWIYPLWERTVFSKG